MRIFFLTLLVVWSVESYGQSELDYITSYETDVYNAGGSVLAISSDTDGILYFAVSEGILIFDGERWTTIPLSNRLRAVSLAYDSINQTMYVGGTKTFGYLQKDSTSRYRYIEISDNIPQSENYTEIWQVVVREDRVLFQAYERLFQFQGGVVTSIDITDSYIFSTGGGLLISQMKGPLFKNEPENAIWDQSDLKGEALFWSTDLGQSNTLLFSPTYGVYRFNHNSDEITYFASPLSDLLKEKYFYDGVRLTDNLMAVGTWENGVFIVDFDGNVLKELNNQSGLLSNIINDLWLGPYGRLWIATEYGISMVELNGLIEELEDENFLITKTNPLITSIIIEDDSVIYPTASATLSLSRNPDKIQINYGLPGVDYFDENSYVPILICEGDTISGTISEGSVLYSSLPNGDYSFSLNINYQGEERKGNGFTMSIQEPWYIFITDNLGSILIGLLILGVILFVTIFPIYLSRRKLSKLVEEKTAELRENQRNLENANKNLRDINDELDNFIYRSSHDLVAPVKSIKGLIEIMRLSKNEDPATYVTLLNERITRLESIISEINTYVKSVKKEPRITKFGLTDLVNEIKDELAYFESAGEIKLNVNTPTDFEIRGDRDRWKIILSNLLVNSIKYYDPNKPNPYVSVNLVQNNGTFKLSIEDNGQGIDRELQDRVFDMFFRAHEGGEGTGLGLFLVKKVVHEMNGDISIASEPKMGTNVQITMKNSLN